MRYDSKHMLRSQVLYPAELTALSSNLNYLPNLAENLKPSHPLSSTHEHSHSLGIFGDLFVFSSQFVRILLLKSWRFVTGFELGHGFAAATLCFSVHLRRGHGQFFPAAAAIVFRFVGGPGQHRGRYDSFGPQIRDGGVEGHANGTGGPDEWCNKSLQAAGIKPGPSR